MKFKHKITNILLISALLLSSLTLNISQLMSADNSEVSALSLGHDKKYTVASVNKSDGSFSTVNTYTDYAQAKKRMNELNTADKPHVVTTQVTHARSGSNYTKIVAQPEGGFAQSYPYRKGSVSTMDGQTTLKIYSNKDLTAEVGYVPGHYQMYVHDVIPHKNSFVADVTISGIRGYVDINKIDLIPKSHYGDINGNGAIPIGIGGYEDYYSNAESPYVMPKMRPEYYQVKKNGSYNEISFKQYRTFPGMSDANPTFGIAADWMPVGNYYSNDDIHYFKDFSRKNPVLDGSTQGEFYAYFQWLPVNSTTLHTGDTLRNYLSSMNKTNAVYYNESQAFISNGNKYGMNGLLIFAQANLESAYGTSGYAVKRNNIFGWGAVDSNPDNAHYFPTLSDSIEMHMNKNLAEYMIPSHWKHFGYSFGNMSSGVSYKYASDPLYGMKIASIAYSIDKANGFKDYNNYQFSKLREDTTTNFTTTDGGAKAYTSKKNVNQLVSNLGTSGSSIKTNRTVSNKSNSSIDLTKDFVYFSNSGVKNIKNSGPKANALPSSLVYVQDTKKEYTFKSAQSLRTEWNETSTALTTIPANTKLQGYETNNGYVYFIYNSYKGYVKLSNLNQGNEVVRPSKSGTYNVVDYSNLNLRSEPNTSSKILLTIPKNTKLEITDIGNDLWGKTTYNGKTGYVSFDFLKYAGESPSEPSKPTHKRGDVNGDGRISVADVAMINSHIFNIKKLEGEYLKRADVNGDGRVSVADVALINSHIFKIKELVD